MGDRAGDRLVLVTHFGRPDDEAHDFNAPVLVIIQGPHAYISSSCYPEGQFIPTWNHVTAHLKCSAEIIDEEENLEVLAHLVAKFEGRNSQARLLSNYPRSAQAVARNTVGVRLHVQSFDMLEKLSQNKSPEIVQRVIDELETSPGSMNRDVADVMRVANAAWMQPE